MSDNLKNLDRREEDRADDRQKIPSFPSNATSSSSIAIPAWTKKSAEQDAEDLRHGDQESLRTGTKRNRDPEDHENRDGMLIGYSVNEAADFEKFLVEVQGIVEDHSGDDDKSSEIKQRWADMEDTDTDDMSPDAVYDDISGQQLAGTFVREAHERDRRFGLGSLGHGGQG